MKIYDKIQMLVRYKEKNPLSQINIHLDKRLEIYDYILQGHNIRKRIPMTPQITKDSMDNIFIFQGIPIDKLEIEWQKFNNKIPPGTINTMGYISRLKKFIRAKYEKFNIIYKGTIKKDKSEKYKHLFE